jgi:hypothetical protein
VLLESSDEQIFQSLFDPVLSPEAALAGYPPPPEAVYLPPYNPTYQR